jgi:hypothetical protein
MDKPELNVLSGIPVMHSKEKKEVYYLGKTKINEFETITVIYTGLFKPVRAMTGIFDSTKKRPTVLKEYVMAG